MNFYLPMLIAFHSNPIQSNPIQQSIPFNSIHSFTFLCRWRQCRCTRWSSRMCVFTASMREWRWSIISYVECAIIVSYVFSQLLFFPFVARFSSHVFYCMHNTLCILIMFFDSSMFFTIYTSKNSPKLTMLTNFAHIACHSEFLFHFLW